VSPKPRKKCYPRQANNSRHFKYEYTNFSNASKSYCRKLDVKFLLAFVIGFVIKKHHQNWQKIENCSKCTSLVKLGLSVSGLYAVLIWGPFWKASVLRQLTYGVPCLVQAAMIWRFPKIKKMSSLNKTGHVSSVVANLTSTFVKCDCRC